MTVSRRPSPAVCSALLVAALFAFSAGPVFAQQQNAVAPPPQPAPSRLTAPINEHVLATLKGHVRLDVKSAPDLGAVEDTMPLHLFLLLQRTPAQQADLENLIARQQQPGAPEYHKWLTPAEFGARFGASPQDIATISNWLQSHGFQVRGVLNNASMIHFSGTAGQVRDAFRTQMHYFNIRGGRHAAILQDPQIPAALAPVVVGIHGLNKIPPLMNHTRSHQVALNQETHAWTVVNPGSTEIASPAYTTGSESYNVSPQDLYTIYKVNPVLTGGNLAATATVAVIEESDIEYGTVNSTTGVATGGDVATFRSLFGVPGTLNMHVYHGYGSVTCNDPGIDPFFQEEDIEASLDAEWANATAPSANLIFMSCDATVNDGIFTSLAALVDNNLSDVMSLSYGESEQWYAASDYTFQDGFFSQAAAQGQTILISSGDSGSDVNDQNTNGTAVSGINVSAFSASPLVTAAGGTDFQDLYDAFEGGPGQGSYWSSANSGTYEDALSYVPETSWNDSCASSILAKFDGNYTGAGFCATGQFANSYVVGGSGGISTHYAVPSWQTGTSGYSNSMRAQPDIAGFASSGFWGHALLYCDSNPSYAGRFSCASSASLGAAGGTSFVAPYMAGVFGLLTTATGSRQGVVNPALYALARAQYANPSTATACYANGQASNTGITTGLPAAGCIFNDVTTSNNDVPCAPGTLNCYVDSGQSFGMLSLTGSGSLTVAYPSTVGFDQVTGLGSINVSNLIASWNTAFSSSTSLLANPTTISSTQSTELTATVTSGTPTGSVDTPPALTGTVTFKAATTVVGTCTLSGGSCSASVPASSLQFGNNSMTATFAGSGTYPSSTSSSVTVNVEPPAIITPTVTVAPASSTITTAHSDQVTVTVSGGSGNPTPTGDVTLSSGSYNSGVRSLVSGQAIITVTAGQLAVGSDILTAVYTPDSGSSSAYSGAAGTATVTVTQPSGCSTGNPNPNPNQAAFGLPADFNADCRSDLLWRNTTNGQVAIWLIDGTSQSGSGIPGTVASSWVIQGTGDFDGDGKSDILWRNTSTGQVALWLMNGTSMASSATLGNVASSWVVQGIGDFDGNGKSDILWRNTSTGLVALWLMDGTNIVTSANVAQVANSWAIQGVGDFDGDGKSDILWRNTSTGQVAIWLMDGTGIASSANTATVANSWSIQGVGDFNGDGKSDILWRSSAGQVAIWLMNGTAMTSSATLSTVPAAWVIQGAGDFNGDGKSDILWRNSSNGQVAIWLMNGTTMTSSGVPGTTSPSTWKITSP